MEESKFKPSVKKFLEERGFIVQDIQPKVKEGLQTLDFHVEGKNSNYTIELKIKDDNPEEIKEGRKILLKGEILEKSIPAGPRNKLFGIIEDGVEQIKGYDPESKDYHILWIHSAGEDPMLHNMRFQATLFGTETLVSLRRKPLITCYYFNESAFYTHRNFLDGVILTHIDKLQLCVNTLSLRKNEFRQSDLYQCLSNALLDPDVLNGEDVMVADCNIDRKEENKVRKYLQDKYSLDHLQTMPLTQYSGTLALPNNH